jgi:hypothetical protein
MACTVFHKFPEDVLWAALRILIEVEVNFAADGQSASSTSCRALSGAHDQILISFV